MNKLISNSFNIGNFKQTSKEAFEINKTLISKIINELRCLNSSKKIFFSFFHFLFFKYMNSISKLVKKKNYCILTKSEKRLR